MENKKFFKDSLEFQNYIIENKPEEIWFDDFSEDRPYLSGLRYFERNNEEMVRGSYTGQCFYVNSLLGIHKSYQDKMYVKIIETK